MKTIYFFIFGIAIGLMTITNNLQTPKIKEGMKPYDDGDKYKKEWAKVDSLVNLGQPKSALEIVEIIYGKAKSDKNSDQVIKAFIYRLKLKNSYEENAFENLIAELETEISLTEFPNKNIMHSMVAEMYWMYYNSNRWRFQNRSNTIDFIQNDIKTWSLDQLIDVVIKNYNLSLSNPELLQKTPMTTYDEIIQWGTKPKILRPTLYDFLAHRAIDFFSNQELSLSRPADYFVLKEDVYFGDAKEFVNSKFETKDTLSLHFHGIIILQNLIKFRLANEKEKEAFIDADLKRINFVNSFSVNQNKDSLFLNVLIRLEEKNKENEYSGDVSYQIASYYLNKAGLYDAFEPDKIIYKDNYKKANTICKRVIEKFPNHESAQKCESLLLQMQTKSISFQSENIVVPNQKTCISIKYKNIEDIHIRVAKIDREKIERLSEKHYGEKLFDEIKKASEQVYTQKISVPKDDDMQFHNLNYLLEPLPIGYYIIMLAPDDKFTYDKSLVSYEYMAVSNISYIQQKESDGSYNVHVLHRKTGEPLQNVSVQTYYEKYNYALRKYTRVKGANYITDKNGFFTIKTKKNDESKYLYADFKLGSDFLPGDDSYYLYYGKYPDRKTYKTFIFSDRAIYRPGQTVYFKGILLFGDKEENTVASNQKIAVQLYDANYQKVTDLELTSNEYGTYSGTFVLPTNLLNGNFQIYTAYGTKYISVEEYKRPTFEVELLPFTGNYRINDNIEIKGKAKNFAGSMLTDANVKFRVQRQPLWRGWWYWRVPSTTIEIENGNLITNDQGEFVINFKALPDLSLQQNDFLVFNYYISVDVTDLNGETQSTARSLVVGKKALQLDIAIPETLNKEIPNNDLKCEIYTQNLNGQFIPAKGKIIISQLEDSPQLLIKSKWSRPDKHFFTKELWYKEYPGNEYDNENDKTKFKIIAKVLDMSFDTEKNKLFDLSQVKSWKSGQYVVDLESVDAFGNPVNFKKYFTLFSEKEKTLPLKCTDFFSELEIEGEPGDTAKFLLGSSFENVKVLYEIEHKQQIIKKEWISLNKEQKVFEIPIKEEYRGNIAVHFVFVKENQLFTKTAVVFVPYTNKKLDIEFLTFRDKLQPGQNEEWKLLIKGKNGDKVGAEMVATLYDASLDQFKANHWFFNIYESYYASLYWNSSAFKSRFSGTLSREYNLYSYPPSYYYDYFNWFGFSYYGGYYNRHMYVGGDQPVKSVSKTSNAKRKTKDGDKKAESIYTEVSVDESEEITKESEQKVPPPPVVMNGEITPNNETGKALSDVKVRTNFNETAFFFPQLETNENGEIIVKFTVPESLTRWKMMGFAHTKDLKYGFVYNQLVTQKDLMLIPNAPRFFRENDIIEFPVKLSNISGKTMNGKIQLEILDAITLKPINGILDKKESAIKDFVVEAGKNSLVTWVLTIPEGVGALAYKVVAKSENASDGEQKAIPVLTNRMLVTESMPLPIRSKQTKTFVFDKFLNSGKSKTLLHHRLTLEFTSNPAWYAIQALPYIMEYPYECSEQVFSRFYANSIASHIANSTPKVKAVFDSWKNTKGSEALLSNLEKNQELKSVLLEETPWVLQSQNETERKIRIGLLFDLNKMADELERAVKKLEKKQTTNGGWPWFEGMPESRYITQHIMVGMGHLDRLGVKKVRDDSKVWNMVRKSVEFCDGEMKKDYDNLKKYLSPKEMENNNLSQIQIHYFYGRTYFNDVEIPKKYQEAYNYFKGQMEKYWLSRSKYDQGMIALALHRLKTEKIPALIIKSLKENSIENEELGMYWKDNIPGYYWYQAPIETQALMIEAFDEVANDQASVESLKVWLLKQKQTQDWKTTKATVEACYALLMRGSKWLSSDEICSIKMGDMQIDPKNMPDVKTEAGTGYFKTSWSGNEIKPEWGKITVSKSDDGVSWGAVYWQYFEQLDKITKAETPLKLQKKLFREVITNRGKVIEPISENTKLKIGDKIIVRIELRVDREMDYVHMKDMRASGFEPINVISCYKYQDGLGYYESIKDAATNFFFSRLHKGTFVFEYPLRVTHNGNFSNGITTIQCMYAPEFTSHSEGVRVKIEKL